LIQDYMRNKSQADERTIYVIEGTKVAVDKVKYVEAIAKLSKGLGAQDTPDTREAESYLRKLESSWSGSTLEVGRRLEQNPLLAPVLKPCLRFHLKKLLNGEYRITTRGTSRWPKLGLPLFNYGPPHQSYDFSESDFQKILTALKSAMPKESAIS
jgi:hypothetical protein